LSGKIQVTDLDASIDDVLENLAVVEREVQDREGRLYSLRIRPYGTRESRIDGVVLMLQDIDGVKDITRDLMGVPRHPLLSLRADLRVAGPMTLLPEIPSDSGPNGERNVKAGLVTSIYFDDTLAMARVGTENIVGKTGKPHP
jgi:hypothetical protein